MSLRWHFSFVPSVQLRFCTRWPDPVASHVLLGLVPIQTPGLSHSLSFFGQSGRLQGQSGRLQGTIRFRSASVQLSTVSWVQIRVWFCFPGPHIGSSPSAMHGPTSFQSPKVLEQFLKLQDTVSLKSDSWHLSRLPSLHILSRCWVPWPHDTILSKPVHSVKLDQFPNFFSSERVSRIKR